jgi:hypothetical protein
VATQIVPAPKSADHQHAALPSVQDGHTQVLASLHREDIVRTYATDDGMGAAPGVVVSQLTDDRHLILDRVKAEARATALGTRPDAEYADGVLSTAMLYLGEALRVAPSKAQAVQALRSALSLTDGDSDPDMGEALRRARGGAA